MQIIVGTVICLSIVSLIISDVSSCHVTGKWRNRGEALETRLRCLLRKIAMRHHQHHHGDGCIRRTELDRKVNDMLTIIAGNLSPGTEIKGQSRRIFFWPWWWGHHHHYHKPWHFGVGIGGGVYAGWGSNGPVLGGGLGAGMYGLSAWRPPERVVTGGEMHVSQVPTSRPPTTTTTTTKTTTVPATTTPIPTTTGMTPYPEEMLPHVTGTFPPMENYTVGIFPPPITEPSYRPDFDAPSAVGVEEKEDHVVGFPRFSGVPPNGLYYPPNYPSLYNYPISQQYVPNYPGYPPNLNNVPRTGPWNLGTSPTVNWNQAPYENQWALPLTPYTDWNNHHQNQIGTNTGNWNDYNNIHYDKDRKTYVYGRPNKNSNNYLLNNGNVDGGPQKDAKYNGPYLDHDPSRFANEKSHEFYKDPWLLPHQFYWDQNNGIWLPASKKMKHAKSGVELEARKPQRLSRKNRYAGRISREKYRYPKNFPVPKRVFLGNDGLRSNL